MTKPSMHKLSGGIWKATPLLASLLLAASTAIAATYHVSPAGNDGADGLTPGAAWRTVAKVNGFSFAAGDQVLFQRNGEWREALRPTASGAAGNPIVFDAYGAGAKPILWGSDILVNANFEPLGGNSYRIAVPAPVDYILEDGVFVPTINGGATATITANGDPRSNGRLYTACVRGNVLFNNGRDHLVFRNLVVDETAGELSDGNNQGYGIRIQGATNILVEDCEAYRAGRHNIGVINVTTFIGRRIVCAIGAPDIVGSNTIYVSYGDQNGPSMNSDHRWEDCTSASSDYLAFVSHFENGAQGEIAFENFTAMSKVSLMSAPVVFRGGLITGNGSIENWGAGVLIDGVMLKDNAAIDQWASDGIIQNCVADMTPAGGGPTGYGTAIFCRDGANRNIIRFNTLATKGAIGVVLHKPNSQTRMYGNIFAGTNKVFAQWDGPGVTAAELAYCDYNFYPPTAKFQVNWADQNLATWQGYGLDANALSGDPKFVDAPGGYYALQADSPAIDAAAVEAGLVPGTDIVGTPRPPDAADMGAYEYSEGVETATLTMAVNPDGTTTPAVGAHLVPVGVPQAISATPASGKAFVNWTVTAGNANLAAPTSASTTATLTDEFGATVTANFADAPAGATYHVSPDGNDGNDGLTVDTPWRTVAKVNGIVFAPGDHILFARGGVWREQLKPICSGTAPAPIVFGAYGTGAKPKFLGTDPLPNADFVLDQGTTYRIQTTFPVDRHTTLTVDHAMTTYVGMNEPDLCRALVGSSTVNDTPGTYSIIYINTGGSNPATDGKLYGAVVREDLIYCSYRDHLTFRDLAVAETPGIEDYYGVRITGGTGIRMERCEAYGVGRVHFGVEGSQNFVGEELLADTAMPGQSYAKNSAFFLQLAATATFSNCQVVNLDPAYNAIGTFDNGGSVTFSNLTATAGNISTLGSMVLTLEGGTLHNCKVEQFGGNARFDGVTFTGSSWIDCWSTGNVYENCLFPNNQPAEGGTFAFRDGADNNIIRFCTVKNSAGVPVLFRGSSAGTTWYGNIFLGNPAVVSGGAGNTVTTDYNFYNANPTFNGTSFAAWQSGGADAHALTGDPLFVDAPGGNYGLQAASPCVDAAAGAAVIPAVDILGTPRPPDAADMGAYEYTEDMETATLTMAVDPDGTTTPAVGAHLVPVGVPQAITATPASGKAFVNWTVTAGNANLAAPTSASTAATLTDEFGATVTANFADAPAGATYHVSPDGNDGNDGLTVDTPWRTVAKVNGFALQAGDQVLFKRGGEWREALRPTASGEVGNPIVFDAYDAGSKPILWGSDILVNANFTPAGGDNYQIAVPVPVTHVLEDGVFIPAVNGGATVTITPTGDPRTNGRLYTACVRGNVLFNNFQSHVTFRNFVVDQSAGEVGVGGVEGYGIRIQGGTGVRVEDCETYRGGKCGIGMVNADTFTGQGILSAHLAPDVADNWLYLAYADTGTPDLELIDCIAGPGDVNANAFIATGTVGQMEFVNFTAEGEVALYASGPVSFLGGLLHGHGYIRNLSNGALFDGVTFNGNAGIDQWGADGIIQNCVADLDPVGGEGPGGFPCAIVCHETGAVRNIIRFNTFSTKNFVGVILHRVGTQTQMYGNIFAAADRVFMQWDGAAVTAAELAYCDYNLYPGTATFQVDWANRDLATWQGYGFDANAVVGDPLFVDAAGGDYALGAGSPAIDAARVDAERVPATDFAGTARPVGDHADMGAHEYTTPPEMTVLTMAVHPLAAGTTVPAVGSHTVVVGAPIDIAATPAVGQVFVGWQATANAELASAASASTTATLSGSATVTAVFADIPPEMATLTMAVSPDGSGTTTPAIGEHQVEVGVPQAITATPGAPGLTFIGWTLDGDATLDDADADDTTVTVNTAAGATVTANFAQEATLTMAVSPGGGGTTTPAVGTHPVGVGEPVAITAAPGVGMVFVNWSVGGDATLGHALEASTTVTVNTAAGATVTANFAQEATLIMAASPDDGGTTTPAVGAHQAGVGVAVAINATPNALFGFVGWEVVAGNADIADANEPDTTVTLQDGDGATVQANFVDIREKVATGSRFAIGNDEVGLDDPFIAKPKAYTIYDHPLTGKAGLKAAVKVTSKVGAKQPVVEIACEWTKKIRLYDAKALAMAWKEGVLTEDWLAADPERQQPLLHALRLASKKQVGDVFVRNLYQAPPQIDPPVITETSIMVTGHWFGTKKPKAWLERIDAAKGQVRRLNLKMEKPDGEEGRVDAKGKPIYMNPGTGASKLVLVRPAKLPKGVTEDDLTHVVIDNGTGIAVQRMGQDD
jgi:hypothetical protein